VAVIYDRGRGVLDNELPEGLHLKVPLWQVATIMDTRLNSYTMSIAETEGSYYGDDSIESLTKDGQKVYVDVTIQYKIMPDDASWIYQNIGNDVVYLEKIIRPGARNVIRDVVTGFDSTNLFTQETRLEAQEMMRSKLEELYGKNQISLEDVLLRNIKFSEVYLQAIEDKQVAQQRIQKADYEKQEAEKLKEKKIIEAQAEAEAIRLKGETLRANPQVIQFQFVDKMAPNITWGILPSDAIPFLDLKSMTQ
jgi:regulator of protease activity HflC (stomatin/prohibitin superfamily)